MKSNINIRILALFSALVTGYLLGNFVPFDGKVKQCQESAIEMSKAGYLGWRSRKLLEVNINSEIIQARKSCKRGPSRCVCPKTPTITQCPTCVCPKTPTITQCPTCVCPTTPTTTQCPTKMATTSRATTSPTTVTSYTSKIPLASSSCSGMYNAIMKFPGCNKIVLVKLLNQMRSTTRTDSSSPETTSETSVESTMQITTQTNAIHEVNSTTGSQDRESTNRTTTTNAQTISVSTQSFDNLTTSGSKTAPSQITNKNTELNVTRSMFETTAMPDNITTTAEVGVGRRNPSKPTIDSLLNSTTGRVSDDTGEIIPPNPISTASTPGNATPTQTATAINETSSSSIADTITTPLEEESTPPTSPVSCVDNESDIDSDQLKLKGCNLVCRGLGFCDRPSEVTEMLPEICISWLHVYCEESSASYIDCLMKYIPISGPICPGKESQEVQRIGICRNCTNHCLANTFTQRTTEGDSCAKSCSEKHSCVKLSKSQKKKNLSKLSRDCRKCLKFECGDGGNERFKQGCDYNAIIGDCQQLCSDIYACDFCYTC